LCRYRTTPVKPMDSGGASTGGGSDDDPSEPPPTMSGAFRYATYPDPTHIPNPAYTHSPYSSYMHPIDVEAASYQTPPVETAPFTQPSPVDQGPSNQFSPGRISPKRKGKAAAPKAHPGRTNNYTTAEDIALCSAFLNVCKDPIVGVNQTYDGYWARIHQYFTEHGHGKWSRSPGGLATRWKHIQKQTLLFASIKAQIDRKNQSGLTEDNRVSRLLHRCYTYVSMHSLSSHFFPCSLMKLSGRTRPCTGSGISCTAGMS
jgi:hypothetical protein